MPSRPTCGQESPDGFRFCGACGAALAPAAQPAGPERRVVTVLFCDLVDFTSRSDQADPEDVGAMLRPYHARQRTEIERLGGTLDKFVGDAVMAVFGAPGVGKSRLVRELSAFVDAQPELVTWRQGRCLPYGDGITFWALARSSRPRPGSWSPTAPPWPRPSSTWPWLAGPALLPFVRSAMNAHANSTSV